MSVANRLNTQSASSTTHSADLALAAGTGRKIVVVLTMEVADPVVSDLQYNGAAMTVVEATSLVSGIHHVYAYYDVPDALAADTYAVTFGISPAHGPAIHGWQLASAGTGAPTFDNDFTTGTTAAPAISAVSDMDLMTVGYTGSSSATPSVSCDEVTLTQQDEATTAGWSSRGADGTGDATETVTADWSGGSGGIVALLIGVAAAASGPGTISDLAVATFGIEATATVLGGASTASMIATLDAATFSEADEDILLLVEGDTTLGAGIYGLAGVIRQANPATISLLSDMEVLTFNTPVTLLVRNSLNATVDVIDLAYLNSIASGVPDAIVNFSALEPWNYWTQRRTRRNRPYRN